MRPPDDIELLEASRAGDARALEQLLARHEGGIYRYGLRMCGNEADARDVVQETLLAAFRNLDAFRGDAKLSTWLYQLARSFCTKQRRRREGQPAAFDDLGAVERAQVAAGDAPPDERSHAREVGQVLELAMRALEPDHREVLVLRDVEGLSAEEAAAVVGIDVGALKSRLHRARLALKRQLGAVLDEPDAPLACPALADELSAFAASEIDQAACLRIEAHLSDCARCRGACETLKRTVALCRSAPDAKVPPSVQAAIRRALRADPAT